MSSSKNAIASELPKVTAAKISSLLPLFLPIFGMALLLCGTAAAKNGPQIFPPSVLTAKSVYVDNQTTEAQFQHIVYTELLRWGRFQIADTPQKADLIIRITNSNMVKFVSGDEPAKTPEVTPVSATTQSAEEPVPPGFTRITLVNPRNGSSLWSGQKKTSGSPGNWHLLDGLRDLIEKAHNNSTSR